MIIYDDEVICGRPEEGSKVREKEVTDFSDTEKSVLVYPNPTNGILNFQIKNTLTFDGTIHIYNLTDRLIQTESILESTRQFSVTLSTLLPSVYHFRIQDRSLRNPTSWLWDFGDGTISVEENPTHEFAAYGMYNVCLTTTNLYGEDISIINTVTPSVALNH